MENIEPKHLGDLLLVEIKPGWTKDSVTIVEGKQYPLGTVLAKVDGKYLAIDPAGNTAAKKAVGVLAQNIDTTLGERPAVVISRGAAVALSELVFPEGITDIQQAAALSDLQVVGIVAREQI